MSRKALKAIASSKSQTTQQTADWQPQSLDTEELTTQQPVFLATKVSPIGKAPNPNAHAAMINRAAASPQSSQQVILQLQRQYGNRYVNRVLQQTRQLQSPIQAKLTLGTVGDQYEQEADRVAKQVVNQLQTSQSPSTTQKASVQREMMPEEDELRMKPVETIQREGVLDEKNELEMNAVERLAIADGGVITANLEASIQQARGRGQPLPDNIRQPMEQAFGADFSGVKVHTDAQSDRLNQAVQAKAFTTGKDVFFRQGEYNPRSSAGQELLAHELTHVVQQNSGAVTDSRNGISSLTLIQKVTDSRNKRGRLMSIEVTDSTIKSRPDRVYYVRNKNCLLYDALVIIEREIISQSLFDSDSLWSVASLKNGDESKDLCFASDLLIFEYAFDTEELKPEEKIKDKNKSNYEENLTEEQRDKALGIEKIKDKNKSNHEENPTEEQRDTKESKLEEIKDKNEFYYKKNTIEEQLDTGELEIEKIVTESKKISEEDLTNILKSKNQSQSEDEEFNPEKTIKGEKSIDKKENQSQIEDKKSYAEERIEEDRQRNILTNVLESKATSESSGTLSAIGTAIGTISGEIGKIGARGFAAALEKAGLGFNLVSGIALLLTACYEIYDTVKIWNNTKKSRWDKWAAILITIFDTIGGLVDTAVGITSFVVKEHPVLSGFTTLSYLSYLAAEIINIMDNFREASLYVRKKLGIIEENSTENKENKPPSLTSLVQVLKSMFVIAGIITLIGFEWTDITAMGWAGAAAILSGTVPSAIWATGRYFYKKRKNSKKDARQPISELPV